jgi:glycosyltransferase involved in cell wall biosynthesis
MRGNDGSRGDGMAKSLPEAGGPQEERPSVLFLYPRPASEQVPLAERGEIPTDRMYGLVELRRRGWKVDVSDHRHRGFWGTVIKAAAPFVRLVDPGTALAIARHDVIVVKDDLSVALTACARILGKKLIYLDAVFASPRRFWKRWAARWSVRRASAVVCLSTHQANVWARALGVGKSRFEVLKFGIDVSYYRSDPAKIEHPPFVLSVGRDTGRDFETLVEAMKGTGIGVKLVTLPYLVPASATSRDDVEVLERVSYGDLFRLYARALLVVVPLAERLDYPSGVRATLEALLLGKAVVVTRTPVLEEYFRHGTDAVFCDPGNPAALRSAVEELAARPGAREELERGSPDTIRSRYSMMQFADGLEEILIRVSGASR